MQERIGIELTPHLFRHLAVRLFLEALLGHYEEVLGHRRPAADKASAPGRGEAPPKPREPRPPPTPPFASRPGQGKGR